jgi:tetraacyldisaccharide 4'-kinase
MPWAMLRRALAPASALYAGAIEARNAAYAVRVLPARAVPARTVSIGNVRVGGSGKTPLVRWLAAAARERGVPVAIVSRGYGGASRQPHVVGDGSEARSDVAASGDEAVMLARTAGVPVVAGRDRVAAARLAVATFGAKLLLCDDAFQHRRLKRDLDLVLLDPDEPGGLLRLLPAGPLREPLRALRRADVVALCVRDEPERGRDDLPASHTLPLSAHAIVLEVRLAPAAVVVPESGTWCEQPLAALAGRRVMAVSGVAQPGALYSWIREWGAELVHVLEYPDHHPYDHASWQEIVHAGRDAELIVTTEKDLVKLDRFPFERGKLAALRLGVTVDRPAALIERVLGDAAT